MTSYFAAHWLEWLGVVTTVVGLGLMALRKVIGWPITLVSDLIYLYVFYKAALYSDALLQIFFVLFVLYGWWNWAGDAKAEGEVKVAPLPVGQAVIAVILGIAGSVALGFVMRRLHAALPFVDATLASFSLVGSWWQARRNIANWWLWVVVNAAYIGEYIYKDLWPTAALYLVLAGLAVVGIVDWRAAQKRARLVTSDE